MAEQLELEEVAGVGKGSVEVTLPGGATVRVEGEGVATDALKAVWPQKLVNQFPDGSFLYVEPGEKDDTGRTKPRSKRHFPYKDSAGAIDLPHLRNAIARIPQSTAPGLTEEKKTALQEKARKLLERETATKRGAFELTGRILKAAESDGNENPIHEVTSVVLEPNPEDDSQGDTYTEDDVLQAQRSFALSMKVNLMHAAPIGKGVYIVENYIARAAFEENGQAVKKGSWIATAQVDEREQPELWAGIKSGAITTWSIEGDGVRTPIAEEEQPAAA
jgi:hypothetical protein